MTTENDRLCEDLRAWMRSPAIGLGAYSEDSLVQRRVGGILANFCTRSFSAAGTSEGLRAPVTAGRKRKLPG